jgi:hypothetical protein
MEGILNMDPQSIAELRSNSIITGCARLSRSKSVYFGRGPTILSRRENVKLKTIEGRRRLHHSFAAKGSTQMDQILP